MIRIDGTNRTGWGAIHVQGSFEPLHRYNIGKHGEFCAFDPLHQPLQAVTRPVTLLRVEGRRVVDSLGRKVEGADGAVWWWFGPEGAVIIYAFAISRAYLAAAKPKKTQGLAWSIVEGPRIVDNSGRESRAWRCGPGMIWQLKCSVNNFSLIGLA